MVDTLSSNEMANALVTVLAANSLGHLKSNTVLARLVARDWENTPAAKGSVIRIPKRGAMTAYAKAANTAITLNQVNDDKVDVALSEHWEVSFLIEDYPRALTDVDYLNGYTVDGIMLLAEKVDASLAALYDGFDQTIDATAGNGPLDAADFREARRLLNSAKAPLSGRFAVLHEDAEADAYDIEQFINQQYRDALWTGAGGALQNAYTRRFMGFDTFVDQNIVVATNVCENIFGHRNAVALVTRPLPAAPAGMGVVQKVMSEDDLGIRITLSYDPDLLGVKVTMDTLWGCAELRDNHGVVVQTDEH